MRILAVTVLALALAVVAAPSAEARTYCGTVTMKYSYGSFDFKTYRIKGKITCRSVRSTMRKSITRSDVAPGWDCVKRGAQRPYDITCTRGARKIGAISEV